MSIAAAPLRTLDPEIFAAISAELGRQQRPSTNSATRVPRKH
jgi:hypothetical protein